MLIVDTTNNHLYELYALLLRRRAVEGRLGAFFDMNTNNRRPEGWTSADAAGLAILPGPRPLRRGLRDRGDRATPSG